ncbi:MAG: 4Fe-4S dicluster domain-containing protein [Methanomassiliicoccales archaeon]
MIRRVLVRSGRCVGCRSCEIACMHHHLGESNGDLGSRPLAVPRIKVECGVLDRTQIPSSGSEDMSCRGNLRKTVVILCQHCDEPECVGACIAGALTKDQDGAVRHHPELCIGCLLCIMACPYEAMYRDPLGKTVVKCDLCGGKETPSCVEACKVGALYLESDSGGGK